MAQYVVLWAKQEVVWEEQPLQQGGFQLDPSYICLRRPEN
jgi:hypothetical protein